MLSRAEGAELLGGGIYYCNVGDQLVHAIGSCTISGPNTPPNLRLYRSQYYTKLNQILALNRALLEDLNWLYNIIV